MKKCWNFIIIELNLFPGWRLNKISFFEITVSINALKNSCEFFCNQSITTLDWHLIHIFPFVSLEYFFFADGRH